MRNVIRHFRGNSDSRRDTNSATSRSHPHLTGAFCDRTLIVSHLTVDLTIANKAVASSRFRRSAGGAFNLGVLDVPEVEAGAGVFATVSFGSCDFDSSASSSIDPSGSEAGATSVAELHTDTTSAPHASEMTIQAWLCSLLVVAHRGFGDREECGRKDAYFLRGERAPCRKKQIHALNFVHELATSLFGALYAALKVLRHSMSPQTPNSTK